MNEQFDFDFRRAPSSHAARPRRQITSPSASDVVFAVTFDGDGSASIPFDQQRR